MGKHQDSVPIEENGPPEELDLPFGRPWGPYGPAGPRGLFFEAFGFHFGGHFGGEIDEKWG